MIGIYKITNKLNGKVYIGQSRDIDARWRQHINAKDNYAIHNAIKKYGKENFSFEILLECPAEMLNVWERDMIALYDCISPNGYNLTEGGEGHHLSEETRLKLSESNKDHIVSEETRHKISESQKGRHVSEKTKKKMSEAKKGIKRKSFSVEHKRKISESMKGKTPWNKGKTNVFSEETKHKISESKKGHHVSEEQKRKISESHKGRHWKIENGKRIWY